ncbi:glycosyl transferase family 1 [Sphingomonas sp. Root710]|nr:glycosyl transferase family 1 [Sphingomonas sp. Root710]
MDRNGTSPLAEFRLFVSLFWVIFIRRPDFVFSFTIKNNIYSGIACRILKIPFAPNVTGLGPAFSMGGVLGRTIRILYRYAFRRSVAVFFQNESDRRIFLEGGLVPAKRAYQLPGSGVDLAHFTFSAMPSFAQEVRFLLVARMLWDKGIGLFAEAARQVRLAYPYARFQLLGPLDAASKTGIPLSQIESWATEGVVEYLGSTQDVRAALQQAHFVVLPSYYREGTPRSLLEAAATGRPIITTDMPGCRDAIVPGLSGLLVRPQNVADLSRACIELLRKTVVECSEMGTIARRHMERHFDERIVVQVYMELLVGEAVRSQSA